MEGMGEKQKSTHLRAPIWVAEKIELHAKNFRRTNPGQIEQMLLLYDQIIKEFRHDNIAPILDDIRRWRDAAQKKS